MVTQLARQRYIVNPGIAMACGRAEREKTNSRQVYATYEAAVAAAVTHTLSEPWRTSAQLLWQDDAGQWHRNWYTRQGVNGPLTVEQD